MGLMFLVFGLNGVMKEIGGKGFIPEPKTAMPERAVAFAKALQDTGYMFKLVMGTQLLVGVLLLLNVWVPLALALLAPILVGIVTFHLFLAPEGTGVAIVVSIMELYLAWAYRSAFRPMLAFRARPG
jgi:hypothetical protein